MKINKKIAKYWRRIKRTLILISVVGGGITLIVAWVVLAVYLENTIKAWLGF